MRNKCIVVSTLIVAWACLTVPARAITLLDDHFDDGVITTNTAGTGTGFTTRLFSTGSVTEAGTTATLGLAPGDFAQIVSNDAVNAFDATTAAIVWELSSTGGLLDAPPGNRRVVLGLQTGATSAADLFLPLGGNANQAGLWVFLTNGVYPHPTDVLLGSHGNLIFVSSTGVGTSLATWDWATYNMDTDANITVSLNTSSTSYALSFSQGVTNLVGSLAGVLPSAAPASVRVGIFDQIGGGSTSGSTIADRISINTVPEPSSILLAGLGVIGVTGTALRRTRRRR